MVYIFTLYLVLRWFDAAVQRRYQGVGRDSVTKDLMDCRRN